jgi:hypothetical protein
MSGRRCRFGHTSFYRRCKKRPYLTV